MGEEEREKERSMKVLSFSIEGLASRLQRSKKRRNRS